MALNSVSYIASLLHFMQDTTRIHNGLMYRVPRASHADACTAKILYKFNTIYSVSNAARITRYFGQHLYKICVVTTQNVVQINTSNVPIVHA